jgi:hypothetical protein
MRIILQFHFLKGYTYLHQPTPRSHQQSCHVHVQKTPNNWTTPSEWHQSCHNIHKCQGSTIWFPSDISWPSSDWEEAQGVHLQQLIKAARCPWVLNGWFDHGN